MRDFALLKAFKVAILASKTAEKSRMPAETIPDADAIPVIDLGPYLGGESGALDRVADSNPTTRT